MAAMNLVVDKKHQDSKYNDREKKEMRDNKLHQTEPVIITETTTRSCEFRESDDTMTSSQVAFDVCWLLEDHYYKEKKFLPQAMILVRKVNEAIQLAEDFNKCVGKENYAVAVLGRDSSPRKRKAGRTPLDKFTDGEYRVAITCGVALQGYDNTNVTLCVILRKIVTGRQLFSRFIGRCRQMHLNLGGDVLDRTVGTVISYAEFKVSKIWDDMACISDNDPVKVDDNQ